MEWFGVVLVLLVSCLCFRYSGWYWFLFILFWLFGVSFGMVTLTYIACMAYLALEKDTIYFLALFLIVIL